jgi:hypothetical protein
LEQLSALIVHYEAMLAGNSDLADCIFVAFLSGMAILSPGKRVSRCGFNAEFILIDQAMNDF